MRVGAFAVGLSGREIHKRKGWKKGVLLIHLSCLVFCPNSFHGVFCAYTPLILPTSNRLHFLRSGHCCSCELMLPLLSSCAAIQLPKNQQKIKHL